MRYSHEDWLRLGRTISSDRMAEGFTDTRQWCDIVGRSDRMLLGLERGEPVGKRTLQLIEDALDWPTGRAFAILDGSPAALAAVERAPAPSVLTEATDEQLLEELRRRLCAMTESEAASDGAPIVTVSGEDDPAKVVEIAPTKRSQRARKSPGGHPSGS